MEWFCRVVEDSSSLNTIIIIGYRKDGKVFAFYDGEFNEVPKHGCSVKKSLVLPQYNSAEYFEMGTALIDGLIRAGFKPTKPVENTQQVTAVKAHLEDMRSLVFKTGG